MPTTTTLKRADLYYKEGSSDKVYHIWVEKVGSDYYTKFEYGRRGSTLNKGVKVGPTNEPKASAFFKKTVDEKLAKGYKPLPSTAVSGAVTPKRVPGPIGVSPGAAAAFSAPPSVTIPGLTEPKTITTTERLVPMLLNDVDEAAVPGLLATHIFWLQEKHDGKRMMLNFKHGGLNAINKTGKLIEPPREYWEAIEEHFKGFDFLIDGEACGPIFWVFDLLFLEGSSQMSKPYQDRLDNLGMLMRSAHGLQGTIRMVGTATTTSSKEALFDQIKARNGEGVVFKDKNANYNSGRPNSGGPALKFKFKATATCYVTHINDKRSAQIAVDDKGTLVDVGNVAIPISHEIPGAGCLVEVQYLYAYKGGSLFQPVYKGKRDDTEIEQLSKLKFKAEVTT